MVGNEDEYEWLKYKSTANRNLYYKTVQNPIKQVKRQIYLLANYLDYYGKKVWIEGYVMMIQQNSPVHSKFILSTSEEIDKAIHTKGRNRLTQKDVEQINNILM